MTAYSAGVQIASVLDQTPQASTMDAFLDALDASHGGAVGWLAEHGFGADDAAALRARLRDG